MLSVSGLACNALTRSGEKLTGEELVKTCCVLVGGGFEEFWPMASLQDGLGRRRLGRTTMVSTATLSR